MKNLFYFCLLASLFACNSALRDETGFIQAGQLKVYYEREGKGPDLLLLHAGLQQLDMWEPQVNELKNKFTILRIDLPGHGLSEGSDSSILVADVIKNILDSLGIEKISVAGLSMGSVSAQDFAIAYPQYLNKLILMAPGVNGFEKVKPVDSLSMAWYSEMLTYLEKKDTMNAALAFTRAWAEGPYRELDVTRPVTKYVVATTRYNMRMHKLSGWPNMQMNPPAFEKLSTIKAPTLIIHGDKDLPYIMECSLFLEKNILGSKRVLIQDVAHMFNMEKPSEVNKLIADFLSGK